MSKIVLFVRIVNTKRNIFLKKDRAAYLSVMKSVFSTLN